jgi:predicted transcriptional regulator
VAKRFKFERLTLSECNTLLKLAYPDMNKNSGADELTRKLILARQKIKKSTRVCLNPECRRSFRPRKAKNDYGGKYCCNQCSSRHRQCQNKNLPMLMLKG